MKIQKNDFYSYTVPTYRVLVIYDVSKTKRRNQLIACLEQYLQRVQKSAFEGTMTKKQYDRLLCEAPTLIDKATDSLRAYIMTDHAAAWGRGKEPIQEALIV